MDVSMIFQERENGHVIQDSVERGEVPGTQSEIKNFICQCFKRKSGQATPTFNLISTGNIWNHFSQF